MGKKSIKSHFYSPYSGGGGHMMGKKRKSPATGFKKGEVCNVL